MQQGSSIRLGRIAGGVAGVVGLAVAELGAGLIARDGSPVSDVAEVIVAVLPDAWASVLTDALGGWARAVLLILVVVGALVLAVISGQLELKRKQLGLAVLVPAGIFTLLAVSTQVGPGALGYVPAVLGLAAGYLALRLLVAELRRPPGSLEPVVAERRSFLKTAGLVTLGGIVVATTGRMLVQATNKVADVRTKIVLPPAANPAPTLPAGVDFSIAGLTDYITPNESFYRIDTALQLPVIDPEVWQLKVTGLVATPLILSYANLLARPLTERASTLTCMSNQVGGDLVGNAVWLGVPVHEILAEAQPESAADMVLAISEDGWSAGAPLSTLTDPDRGGLLAVGMNGEPLPPQHGFPVRMVVPGLYGDVSATKWLTELKVSTFEESQGYWAQRGWSKRGRVKMASRIDVPRRSVVETGTVIVAGVAWAQPVGIAKVEVRIDDGAWREAELAETVAADSWRQWVYKWAAEAGNYVITVRATDADGRVQTERDVPPFPNGASGLDSVTVKVRPK
ncbi:MAG: molybdopterin-dependent oxidoreductase [Microlunatus sp.]|nr:molybdopterin-dependent oxidoreductase [Microlunatus sp.]